MKVSIKQAIEHVEKMFGFTENTFRYIKDGGVSLHEKGNSLFLIDKKMFPRYEVIDKLQAYFADKTVDGGGCWISPITFVFTEVVIGTLDEIEKRSADFKSN